jgi:uncharacterized membrane protein YraQ (UPF0718 family)
MNVLLIVTLAALLVSLAKDRARTGQGIRKGIGMFLKLLPSLLNVLALVAIVLALVPQQKIEFLLGSQSGVQGYIAAAIIGSVSLIPGFIAYPLCGVLMKSGIPVGVLAVFITTLMMVGVLTLPLEIQFFGLRAALLRNGLSLLGAVVIGSMMAVIL